MDIQQIFQEALALHRSGRLTEAEGLYRDILSREQGSVDACYNLGLALANQGRFVESVEFFRRAIALQPGWAAAHENLGNALTEAGELDLAIASLQKAISLRPEIAKTYSNLAAALNKQGSYTQAVAAAQRAIALDKGFIEAHNNLGNAFHHLNSPDQAISSYRHAISLNPDYADAHSNLGDALARACQPAAAKAAWQRAHALKPNFGLLLKNALVLPPIIRSREQMLDDRRKLESAVAEFASLRVPVPASPDQIDQPAFYSAYMGFNDRDLQIQIARIMLRAVPDLAYVVPQCAHSPSAARPTGRRIRVGFISRLFYSHTIGKVNAGLIQTLSRDKFEVIVLKFAGPRDELSAFIESKADHLITLPLNLAQSRQIIADQRLDALLYADIGMDPFTYLLAFSRLAPVQAALWGHPVTTGIPTIDYYVSSVDWEPEDAETHYTERLVRLNHLPVFYYRTAPPPTQLDCKAPGLPGDAHVYLCPQSLFKMHPDFDPVLRRILQVDLGGVLLLPQGANPTWTKELLQRFGREMPDVVDRIHFFPRADHERFRQIIAAADVMVDPTPFGGGQTSFDALALGTPIVTLPGSFMRGRLTYAMYKQMGVQDCIATSLDDYVKIAVRLAGDRAWREQVKATILAARDRLFENPAGVRDLEQFLIKAVGGG